MRQKGILLGAVEAVNLINEDDGAGTVVAGALGFGHDLLDLFYAGHDGGELDKFGLGTAGDDFGEGGFADAGRSPEKDAANVIALDLHAQSLAGSEDVLLSDELVEIARAHTVGQGASAVGGRVLRIGEEVHGGKRSTLRECKGGRLRRLRKFRRFRRLRAGARATSPP